MADTFKYDPKKDKKTFDSKTSTSTKVDEKDVRTIKDYEHARQMIDQGDPELKSMISQLASNPKQVKNLSTGQRIALGLTGLLGAAAAGASAYGTVTNKSPGSKENISPGMGLAASNFTSAITGYDPNLSPPTDKENLSKAIDARIKMRNQDTQFAGKTIGDRKVGGTTTTTTDKSSSAQRVSDPLAQEQEFNDQQQAAAKATGKKPGVATPIAATNLIQKFDDALLAGMSYQTQSFGGTGFFADKAKMLFQPVDRDALKQRYNDLALDKMVQMFSGMSKAIDSDSERAFFNSTVASTDKSDLTNYQVILGSKAAMIKQDAFDNPEKYGISQEDILNRNVSAFVDIDTGDVVLAPKTQIPDNYMDLDSYAKQLANDSTFRNLQIKANKYRLGKL